MDLVCFLLFMFVMLCDLCFYICCVTFFWKWICLLWKFGNVIGLVVGGLLGVFR